MPNRILRDWTDSQAVDSLPAAAEVFFTRLIMKADDFGRFHGNPGLLRAALFPLRVDSISLQDMQKALGDCASAGLVSRYRVGDRDYLQINQFGQRTYSARSKFPAPEGRQDTHAKQGTQPATARAGTVGDADVSGSAPPTKIARKPRALTGKGATRHPVSLLGDTLLPDQGPEPKTRKPSKCLPSVDGYVFEWLEKPKEAGGMGLSALDRKRAGAMLKGRMGGAWSPWKLGALLAARAKNPPPTDMMRLALSIGQTAVPEEHLKMASSMLKQMQLRTDAELRQIETLAAQED